MAKKDEFSIQVSKDVFEKVIADLNLITLGRPLQAHDGFVLIDYWYDDATGLAMAKRVNGYDDVPENDPSSKPRYFIVEYAAKEAGIEQK